MRQLYVVVSILFMSMQTFAESSTQAGGWASWQEAKDFYDSGKYDEALRSLQAAPKQTANFYYNLGTVAYQAGRHGEAVAYLEKANRMRPHDSGIQHNLRLARNQLARRIGEDRLDPASSWMEKLADQLPFDEVRAILAMIAIILVLFWARAYWRTRSLIQTLIHPAAVLAGLAVILMAGLYFTERAGESHAPAIAIEPVLIRSGPGESFTELARVEPGSKVRVLGESDIWRQIRFGSDEIGWVPASSLLLL